MAQPGREISNPVSRFRLRFLRTAEQTGGELLEIEAIYEPGSIEPPAHLHPRQRERFEILAGTMRARIGERRAGDRGAGETVEIPAGTVHAIWNPGPDELRTHWQTRPALRSEQFLEVVCALAQRGRLTETGVRSPLEGAALLREFRDELRLAGTPALFEELALPPLALLARLLGRAPAVDA